MSVVNSLAIHAYRLLLRLSQALMIIAVALLGLMAVLVFSQVVARNAFDLGLPWADELARFSSVAVVYLAMPLLAIRGQHVAIDLLPQLLGGKAKVAMAALAEIGVFAFCAITLYGMHAYLMRAGKFATPAMGMSNWVFYAPATIGVSFFALIALLRLASIAGAGNPTEQQAGGHS